MVNIHDLVWFSGPEDLITSGPLPSWVLESIAKAPVGIVRRGQHGTQELLIGIRGGSKAQRFATKINCNHIIRLQSTQSLLEHPIPSSHLPLWRGLPVIKDYLIAHQLRWGLSGSAAYELATGIPTVNEDSDLDLIALDPPVLELNQATIILNALKQFSFHADVQILHGQVGFSLEEYVNHPHEKILLKTATGPVLSSTPWEF